jgi:hypothetical protein
MGKTTKLGWGAGNNRDGERGGRGKSKFQHQTNILYGTMKNVLQRLLE